MDKELQALTIKYNAAVRDCDHVRALKLMKQIAELTRKQVVIERKAVGDMFGSMTEKQKSEASTRCLRIMVYAELLDNESTELDGLLQKVSKGYKIELAKDVKAVKHHANKIVANVDYIANSNKYTEQSRQEFLDHFIEMADKVSYAANNIIFTEESKYSRAHE